MWICQTSFPKEKTTTIKMINQSMVFPTGFATKDRSNRQEGRQAGMLLSNCEDFPICLFQYNHLESSSYSKARGVLLKQPPKQSQWSTASNQLARPTFEPAIGQHMKILKPDITNMILQSAVRGKMRKKLSINQ